MSTAKQQAEKDAENNFEWIAVRDVVQRSREETIKEKFVRKVGDNPLVPLGCLLTLAALSYGLVSFKKGDRKMSQYMMRTRIMAQGFTITALIIGLGISAVRDRMGNNIKETKKNNS